MKEYVRRSINGWLMLLLTIAVFLASGAIAGYAAVKVLPVSETQFGAHIAASACLLVLFIFLCTGFFTLQPNEALVTILFGDYKGTVRSAGFHWINPFAIPRGTFDGKSFMPNKNRISLRIRNFTTEKIKVNDLRGNPIELAAVIVWRVTNTAQAVFDVADFEHYVTIQSETALRHTASRYAYDHIENDDTMPTLRQSGDIINAAIQGELNERLMKAGVTVDEARITHLAYAPEIAQAMLRRQQAEAVIAARQKIVQGAVSMVEMALSALSERKIVTLDEERKAAMVGNLLVVLCGESEAQPIVNAGTLYH
ncbi:MAG: SPFH domain-containing protein [Spirochaetes bacterium]|nr:SPFH domain-containing protein [Spirochaetota bacterium]